MLPSLLSHFGADGNDKVTIQVDIALVGRLGDLELPM
jgi:hypothetical protein